MTEKLTFFKYFYATTPILEKKKFKLEKKDSFNHHPPTKEKNEPTRLGLKIGQVLAGLLAQKDV